MHPHSSAYCRASRRRSGFGFLAPDYSLSDPVQRERTFFEGLERDREYLLDYVAAGNLGHDPFILDEEPGFPALLWFHALTMQRLGSPCAPLL